jgi:hypothetical protein
MRVLVVGTLPAAIERAAAELEAAGHEVVQCHDGAEAAFPCAGLIEGRECPLDVGPVDVVVTARDVTWTRPAPYEEGAVCALRRHTPLVSLHDHNDPFARWTCREVTLVGDLPAAVEEAAAAPLPNHSAVASAAAESVAVAAGVDPTGIGAVVHRSRGALKVKLTLTPAASDLEGTIAARVMTALREIDTSATGIDIGVDPLAVAEVSR